MKMNKIVNKCSKHLVKKINKVYKKVHKVLTKKDIFVSLSKSDSDYDLYLLFKHFGVHTHLYKKPDCLVSLVLGWKYWSLTVLNLSLTLEWISY